MTETLAHYGVKGMKWGVRKNRDDSPNSRYSQKDRKLDRDSFGKGGEKRINRRMNAGDSHKKAYAKELGRGLGISLGSGAAVGAVLLGPTIASAAMTAVRDLASSAAAQRVAARGAAAAANMMADSRGLTSYRTIALAFDAASGTWK